MAAESRLVIGVAGRIGSGKTAVAHLLETECGFQYLRYSLVLAEWFRADPSAKARLQELGWGVMSGDQQRELNRRLIEQVYRDRDCAIDGLRHPLDLESLKREFSPQFFMIYVDTRLQIRFERVRDRYVTWEKFIEADSHRVESNIYKLKARADFVLDGEIPLDALRKAIKAFVSDRRV